MIQSKTVDITPMKITLPVIEMSQYDLGREVIVHMKDGSDWFDLTGYTAKLQGTKPSGFGYTVDGVVDGHDITFASSYDMTSEAGFIPSEVRLTKDGVSLGSLNVILHVEKTPHDVTVTDGSPETIIPEMTELVERAEAAAEVLLDCSAIATTLPAGSNATASYDVESGVFTFGIPRGNKGDTGDTGATGNGIASITKTGTSGLVDTYTITFTNGTTTTFTVTNGQNGTGAVADVWQNGVSVLDGTTAKVTVPTYDAVTDNEPYLFRASGGGIDIGNREDDTLVGGSVAWNQLVQNGDFADGLSHWGYYDNRGSVTVSNGIATSTPTAANQQLYQMYSTLAGHVYMSFAELKTSTATTLIKFITANSPVGSSVASTSWQIISAIGKATSSGNSYVYFADTRTSGWDAWQTKNVNTFDLTQMFGSTIADAIYAMEQSTAGSGVAFFKRLFPNSYYPYNSDELMSVSGVSSHDMTGFNQWDEEWELGGINLLTGANTTDNTTIRSKNYIKVCSNTTYYLKSGSGGTFNYRLYDENKAYIRGTYIGSNNTLTIPSGTSYLRFVMGSSYGTTYNNDICVNISSSKNGTYEPYELHSYPLDSTLTLRGTLKLSNGKLRYDGDTYASDGTVTRKYGIVDLGSLTWGYDTTGTYPFFRTNGLMGTIKNVASNNTVANMICSRYKTTNANTPYAGNATKCICEVTFGQIQVYDTAYTSASAFKTAMSGVYLIYELATPTTETAEPYTNPQVVDESGTEEYVSTSIVPVGHQTAYPDLFSGDYNDLVNKPTNVSAFTNDAGYISTETDPTVPSWAKQSSKPSYTASEVSYGSSNVQSALDDLYTLKVLVISVASLSSLPQTVTNASITADHVCLKAELGTPSAQTGDWTVTTSAGELTISGSISGSTTATLYLAIKQ